MEQWAGRQAPTSRSDRPRTISKELKKIVSGFYFNGGLCRTDLRSKFNKYCPPLPPSSPSFLLPSGADHFLLMIVPIRRASLLSCCNAFPGYNLSTTKQSNQSLLARLLARSTTTSTATCFSSSPLFLFPTSRAHDVRRLRRARPLRESVDSPPITKIVTTTITTLTTT